MRIGFLAMSGVRVCDDELLALGLTLPGFIERSETIASLPSLGLLTLAGMTPPDEHERIYVEAADARADLTPLLACDLVAVSFLTAQAFDAYALADQLRDAGIRVVMGGLHATVCPDEAKAHADAVVVGEGESVWATVLEDASAGVLRPRYDGNGRVDLAAAPIPAFELLDIDKYNRITIQTCRGCPFQCEFCASSILLTSKYKQKPIDRVLAEVDRICAIWPRPFIEFADDNSFVNRRYWRELLPELAKRRIRWFTETDISVADDPQLLAMLRDAGCAEILVGLESPDTSGLRHLELRADWKRKRAGDALDAVRRIQSHGIRVNGCFVVGLDGQTPAVFDAVYDFVDRAALFDVQITLPTPFPGTPFYRRLEASGRLTHPGRWDRCTLFDLNFVPSPMSAAELREGFLGLMRRLYEDDFLRDRRSRFNTAWRRGRTRRDSRDSDAA